MVNAYANVRIPVKDGADVDSLFQQRIRDALISFAGGASWKDMDEAAREALSWVYTSED